MLFETLHRHATESSDLAVMESGNALTWPELDQLAQALVGRLQAQLPAPRRLVIKVPQRAATLALLAACDRLHHEVILLPASHTDASARSRMEEFEAGACLGLEGEQLVTIATAPQGGRRDEVSAKSAVLVLTSGTSGRPKCARHTWATLADAVKSKAQYRGSRWLLGYPLAHFAGLQVLIQCLFNRGTLIIPESFGSKAGWQALRDQGVEYLCATPTYVRQLLMYGSKLDWSTSRLLQITLGGEIADQPLLDALKSARPGMKLTHTYASTELGAVLSVKDGRAGFDCALLDGARLKVVDEQLFVRAGARAMRGYWGQPALAAGWVATGDRVRIDADRVFFLGRVGDTINVGGAKVNGVEVEQAIRQVAGVVDVRVVAQPSSIVGSLLKAVVVVAPDANEAALRGSIERHCAEQLGRNMVPRLFEFTDALETTSSQKAARNRSDSD